MDSASIFFLMRHLGDLKHLTLGQWISIVGSAATAFGVALAANPGHYDMATTAAAGTLIVAIVHTLQPSPIGKGEKPDAPVVRDSAGRTHL